MHAPPFIVQGGTQASDMHGSAQCPCSEIPVWLGVHAYTVHLRDPFGETEILALDAEQICD